MSVGTATGTCVGCSNGAGVGTSVGLEGARVGAGEGKAMIAKSSMATSPSIIVRGN